MTKPFFFTLYMNTPRSTGNKAYRVCDSGTHHVERVHSAGARLERGQLVRVESVAGGLLPRLRRDVQPDDSQRVRDSRVQVTNLFFAYNSSRSSNETGPSCVFRAPFRRKFSSTRYSRCVLFYTKGVMLFVR